MINAYNIIFGLCSWRLGFLYIESFKVVSVAKSEHFFRKIRAISSIWIHYNYFNVNREIVMNEPVYPFSVCRFNKMSLPIIKS